MYTRRMLAAAAVILFGTGAASASIVSYDLQLNPGQSTNYNSLPASFPLTVDGLTATFTARSFTSVSFSGGIINAGATLSTTPPRIGRYSGGAGVKNGVNDDSHTVDGNGGKDFIEIKLSEKVTLASLGFGYYDASDDFRWMYDSNNDGKIGAGDFISAAISVSSNNPFAGFEGVQTSLFAVGAFNDSQICQRTESQSYWVNGRKKWRDVVVEYECRKEDSWKLKTVVVDKLPPKEEPPAVPLPAAGWLLAAAVATGAALRRRR